MSLVARCLRLEFLVLTVLAALALQSADQARAADLLPPTDACPGQQNPRAPEPRQEDGMHCLVQHARSQAWVGSVSSQRALERAAGRKAGDVVHCGFSHTACGKPADHYVHQFGYSSGNSWQWGENLAWGNGPTGTARSVLKAWLQSEPHRQTLLSGVYEHVGLGLKRSGGRSYWVLQLGCRGC